MEQSNRYGVWWWIGGVVVVALAGWLAYYFTAGNSSRTTTEVSDSQTASPVVTPKQNVAVSTVKVAGDNDISQASTDTTADLAEVDMALADLDSLGTTESEPTL